MLSLCQEVKEVRVCVSEYLSNTIYVCVWSGGVLGVGCKPYPTLRNRRTWTFVVG